MSSSSSSGSSGRALSVIVISVILVAVLFFAPLPSLTSLFDDDTSYYSETIGISISFPEVTEFSILLPIILAENDITPALEGLEDGNPKITAKIVNSTRYYEINDTTHLFGMGVTSFKPNITGSAIAYEDFLFDHSYETDTEGTVSIFLFADKPATVTYTFKGETNLCDSDPQGQMLYFLEVQPGRNTFSVDQLSFAYSCA